MMNEEKTEGSIFQQKKKHNLLGAGIATVFLAAGSGFLTSQAAALNEGRLATFADKNYDELKEANVDEESMFTSNDSNLTFEREVDNLTHKIEVELDGIIVDENGELTINFGDERFDWSSWSKGMAENDFFIELEVSNVAEGGKVIISGSSQLEQKDGRSAVVISTEELNEFEVNEEGYISWRRIVPNPID
ncbi:MAG: hypothetical protein LBV67_09365 [Streptococcaceae bacterium]|jgi:succinate dehydrogenase flavin-adding protein (antitoxin of CptAB toxin-antitoxin module)|nr:hypothetical protein [Streptococcaceae bacterium]